MKKYLIFDFDGTLVKSMGDIVEFIINELSKIENTDIEKARYIFSTSAGTPLLKQIELIYEGNNKVNPIEITNNLYEGFLDIKSDFFEGVPEKIKELSSKYKIFLTTGNSTQVAEKHLKEENILEYFELVYGSDKILKGKEHLDNFKNHTNDKLFFENSFYIGDGDSDRQFAKDSGIDFIHIGNSKKDKFEIKSVKDINNILSLFN